VFVMAVDTHARARANTHTKTHTHSAPPNFKSFCWYETHLVFVHFLWRYFSAHRPGGFVVSCWFIIRHSSTSRP